MSCKESDMEGACAASALFASACAALRAPPAARRRAWARAAAAAPPDSIWHSLHNCVAYQAGVWQSLLSKGTPDAAQPAAFKLALVLRHTPAELASSLLGELLAHHPQSRDLTSYVISLLTECEAPPSPGSPAGPAPARDLQLFADCELAVLAAGTGEGEGAAGAGEGEGEGQYDAHARLVRAEYAGMSEKAYADFRVKILNQFSKLPKLFHTPEFEPLEAAARANIQREIRKLKENGAKD